MNSRETQTDATIHISHGNVNQRGDCSGNIRFDKSIFAQFHVESTCILIKSTIQSNEDEDVGYPAISSVTHGNMRQPICFTFWPIPSILPEDSINIDTQEEKEFQDV